MKSKEDFLYDVRVVNRHIKEGIVTKKDYDKHLGGLPDVEDKSEPLIIEDVEETAAIEVNQEEE
jgi:hypothetical protein